MKKLIAIASVICALCAVASAQVVTSDIVKTGISFNRTRYARGDLVTGTTTSRDSEGTGAVVVMPAHVEFFWKSDRIHTLTPIGVLYTTNGRTNIGDLNFHVSTNVNDDNIYIFARWIPDVQTFLGEPEPGNSKRIPVGT